jgi:ECF sigma factor
MKELSPQEITQLLQSWRGGEQGALEQLVPLVYDELHQLAHRYMGKSDRATFAKRPLWLTKSIYACWTLDGFSGTTGITFSLCRPS